MSMSHQQPWPPEPPPYLRPLPGYQQPYPPGAIPPPRKRRRVFLWVFLAIQVLFVIWVIAGAASGGGIHAQAVAYCHAHPDAYVSFSDCVSLSGGGSKAGTAIGAGIIIVLWVAADVILGVSYGVYRLAARRG